MEETVFINGIYANEEDQRVFWEHARLGKIDYIRRDGKLGFVYIITLD